jgi:hypothetical protein
VLTLSGSLRVFLALEPCDMRMFFDGLHAEVINRIGDETRSAAGFVFTNRSRNLLKLLHFTIDNTDAHLMYTSQFIHCLQVYRAVKNAAAHDPRFEQDAQYRDDMLVGALVHDLGKSLSLFGEADGNVDCMNRVTAYEVDPADQVAVAAYGAKASGLDAVQFQYNHDRFGHDKLLALVKKPLEDYLKAEVLPHVPDAWIDHSKTNVGYEINFTKYFYQYKPLRSLEEIRKDIMAIEQETDGLLKNVIG